MARKMPARRKQPRIPGDEGRRKRRRRIPRPFWRRRAPLPPPDVRYCDVVMKGGITSGVVYAAAIHEIARDHRIHNIGGSSAGAIAAVTAAAAEYGRQTGGPGFDRLAQLPDDLAGTDGSGRTLLQRLFVPQRRTRVVLDLFTTQKAMTGASAWARARAVLPVLLDRGRWSSLTWVIAALAAGAIVWAVLSPGPATAVLAVLVLVVGTVVAMGARAVAGAAALATEAQDAVADNMHGLVNGSSVGDQVGLTEWLHDRIEELAGPVRGEEDVSDLDPTQRPPLTYGDLLDHRIGLVTLTTNVSQQSSETFPFADETWAFDPEVVRTLFPTAVSEHLIRKGTEATIASSMCDQLESQGLLKLPPPREIPVVVGARVSLSFPVLLSAVPLSRLEPVWTDDGWDMRYAEVWLSDGGICSNMPVHLFDRPLPTRPTYGINLAPGGVPHTPDDGGVTDATHNTWRPLEGTQGSGAPIGAVDSTIGLVSAVFSTMQNWADNSLTRSIGVRDRICTIRLAPGEGGLNLDMPGATIRRVARRGRVAGQNLGWMVRGEVPGPLVGTPAGERAPDAQWTRHRWTRLRTSALGLDDHLASIAAAWRATPVPQGGPEPDSSTFAELPDLALEAAYLPYRSRWGANGAEALTEALATLTAVDFGASSSQSTPPAARLMLRPDDDPATEARAAGTPDDAAPRPTVAGGQ